jgi:hypothetical protein
MPILQHTATPSNQCRRIVAPKGAGSTPVGHSQPQARVPETSISAAIFVEPGSEGQMTLQKARRSQILIVILIPTSRDRASPLGWPGETILATLDWGYAACCRWTTEIPTFQAARYIWQSEAPGSSDTPALRFTPSAVLCVVFPFLSGLSGSGYRQQPIVYRPSSFSW